MVFFAYAALNHPNYQPSTGKQRTSSAIPAPAGSFKLDKLKKLWTRRVKPIIVSGSNSTSVSEAHRRRTIVAEMIGFPQDFTHSKHVGIHEMMHVETQLRQSNDVQCIRLFHSGEWSSHLGFSGPEPEGSLDVAHEHPFGSPKYSTRHSTCASPTLSRPTANKVKRKSVPIHILQDVVDSTPHNTKPTSKPEINQHRLSCLSIDESLMQLINYEPRHQSHHIQVDDPGLTCQF